MKALSKLLTEYLDVRRKLGFKTERSKWLLSTFVAFLAARRNPCVTTAHALAWAKEPTNADPSWWASRLSVVRQFAKYIHVDHPHHEIPPCDLLPSNCRRTTPSIYSPEEVARLLQAARAVRSRRADSAFRSATHETLFGLVAATGMRVGETIRLDCADVDWSNRLVVVRESKFRKSREVLLHDSVLRALRRYKTDRERAHPRRRSSAFFVSLVGTRLIYNNVHTAFAKALRQAGIERAQARVHDLRHTFVVQTILRWHRQGLDVDAQMPALSTYLGHQDPSSTYWYLSATPELLALVGRKVQRALGVLP
jgi:integrase/recombinase XerD